MRLVASVVLLTSLVVLASCMSSDTPPRPDGVSAWDHFFGETSVPLNEQNIWFDGPKPDTIFPVKYVTEFPKGCGDGRETPKAGCAQIDMKTSTCQPYVKAGLEHAQRVCAELHEIEGHCAGKYHLQNSVAARSCGPRFKRIAELPTELFEAQDR